MIFLINERQLVLVSFCLCKFLGLFILDVTGNIYELVDSILKNDSHSALTSISVARKLFFGCKRNGSECRVLRGRTTRIGFILEVAYEMRFVTGRDANLS